MNSGWKLLISKSRWLEQRGWVLLSELGLYTSAFYCWIRQAHHLVKVCPMLVQKIHTRVLILCSYFIWETLLVLKRRSKEQHKYVLTPVRRSWAVMTTYNVVQVIIASSFTSLRDTLGFVGGVAQTNLWPRQSKPHPLLQAYIASLRNPLIVQAFVLCSVSLLLVSHKYSTLWDFILFFHPKNESSVIFT